MKGLLLVLDKPERFFLLLATLYGVVFSVFIPYGAGFDEEQHVIRIYDLSQANWIPKPDDPNRGTLFTLHDFFKYSYQRRFFQSPSFDLLLGRGMRWSINTSDLSEVKPRSFYSPFNYIPQALTSYLFWRKYDFPVVPVAILCRIAGLLMYIGLSFLAIRLLPVGKWILVALALAPSALFQASTLNADGFTNGISFFFTAIVLNIALEQAPAISRPKMFLLILAILLVGTAKPGMFVLFPLLLLLPFRRFPGRGWGIATGIAVLVAIAFAVQYNALAVQASTFAGSDEGSLSQQIERILAHPWDFLYTLTWGNLRALGNYFAEWVAVYGHWVGVVPAPVYILFATALVLALGTELPPISLTPLQRLILGATFLISSGTFALLYTINNYVPGSLAGFGHQGRYYIPTAPLLWLALSGLVSFRGALLKKFPVLFPTVMALTLALYTLGLYATYYTYCGTSWYTFQGCVQPVYKNIEWTQTPGLPLSSSIVRQEFPNRCGSIEQIKVYVRSKPDTSDTTLDFILRDSSNQILAEDHLPVNMLPSEAFFTWNLPEEAEKTPATALEISVSGNGQVELALNGGDYFREAHLFVNEQEISDDLVFQYICTPFWKQIIQNVTR
ncbi:DUF2142 domain-containing protein [Anaerolinea thermophila]|uniref:DUF2142 domain-containing protein n=1 Tax=Anaerolinea thermophila TaxID=167964 RepID=UPI0026324C55|nr:DUF2142 domain-containing protein [Anaerolinea thermophila]